MEGAAAIEGAAVAGWGAGVAGDGVAAIVEQAAAARATAASGSKMVRFMGFLSGVVAGLEIASGGSGRSDRSDILFGADPPSDG
jgi:hypothetical protein